MKTQQDILSDPALDTFLALILEDNPLPWTIGKLGGSPTIYKGNKPLFVCQTMEVARQNLARAQELDEEQVDEELRDNPLPIPA